MKRIFSLVVLLALLAGSMAGCKKTPAPSSPKASGLPTEEDATQLATQITNSILNEQPDFLNNLFDTLAIRQAVSANSIVASQLDTELGAQALAYNLKFGDFAVQAVSNGGDFRYLKHYFENDKLHLIFRTYDDFGLQIIDYIFHYDKNHQLKIEDGYIYNMSASLTQNIMYDLKYTIMQNTGMDDTETQHLTKAIELFGKSQFAELLSHLKTYQNELKNYPAFNFLYINSLNETSRDFIADLNAMTDLDERCILVHELIYYTNVGKYADAEQVMQKLIDYTGEDPIYWLFYGKALYNAQEYAHALDAYLNAEKGMEEIWDLWRGKQDCYYKLRDSEAVEQGYEAAKSRFGMSDEEVASDRHKYYPSL